MAYRDELLAARSRLALRERTLHARRAEPARLTAWRDALVEERRRLKRLGWEPETVAPAPERPPPVEEFARALEGCDARELERRTRAVEAALGARDGIAEALAGEIDTLVDECRRLRARPRPTLWPYVAGGLVAAGFAYLVVYSIFVWWLARVSLFGLT
jgi:hypothetical protein